MNRSLVLKTVILLAAAVASMHGAALQAQQMDQPLYQLVMVRLVEGADPASFEADMHTLLAPDHIDSLDSIVSRDVYLYFWPTSVSQAWLDDHVRPRDDVRWAELDYESETAEGRVRDLFTGGSDDATGYIGQYTWDTIGLPSVGPTGAGQLIAVLDTGVDATHPELADRIAPGGWNFITDTADTSDVGDGIDNDNDGDTDEMVGHGTFVAGLIHRAAPDAMILPITVLTSDGTSDLYAVGKGMFHAIDQGATVINVSLGSTFPCVLWADALAEADARGIVMVGAAGNQDTNQPIYMEYPAIFERAIGVGSTDQSDMKCGFSNYSVCSVHDPGCPDESRLTIMAPGEDLHSTIPGGQYAAWNGTSMSAAVVSGAIALILEAHSDWPRDETLFDTLTALLADRATDLDPTNPGYEGMLGHGRLNLVGCLGESPTGDLDGDGDVDLADLGILLSSYGVDGAGDLNGDGVTDLADLGILLAHYEG
jgi:subtilisin family serine protease